MSSFLDRFVHPRLAVIVIGGIVLWVIAFLVAAAGLVIQSPETVVLTVELFLTSGVVGAAGTVVLLCCVFWLAGLRARQVVFGH